MAPGAKIDIQLQGNGTIIANGLDAININLKLLTGKGKIITSGKCENLSIKNVGTGEIQADEVVAKHVKCTLMGTGAIGCASKETLSVKRRRLRKGVLYRKTCHHQEQAVECENRAARSAASRQKPPM